MTEEKYKLKHPEAPSCQCNNCRAMCRNCSCLPMPSEAKALIDGGYGHKMSMHHVEIDSSDTPVKVIGPANYGRERTLEPETTVGGCVFFDGTSCQLHGLGLKPWEGRAAQCSPATGKGNWSLRGDVGLVWDTDEGRSLVREWATRFMGTTETDRLLGGGREMKP